MFQKPKPNKNSNLLKTETKTGTNLAGQQGQVKKTSDATVYLFTPLPPPPITAWHITKQRAQHREQNRNTYVLLEVVIKRTQSISDAGNQEYLDESKSLIFQYRTMGRQFQALSFQIKKISPSLEGIIKIQRHLISYHFPYLLIFSQSVNSKFFSFFSLWLLYI